jgi:hypothetical protein
MVAWAPAIVRMVSEWAPYLMQHFPHWTHVGIFLLIWDPRQPHKLFPGVPSWTYFPPRTSPYEPNWAQGMRLTNLVPNWNWGQSGS